MSASPRPLLEVEGLTVTFPTDAGPVRAVSDVWFHVKEGETLAVVGESGSGKSVTGLSLMGLHPKSTRIEGSVRFEGRELLGLKENAWRALRGRDIAMIFQDPMTAMNPVFTVGDQIVEMLREHAEITKAAAKTRAIELLELVGVPQPARRFDQYPHEFSGGMRQRAMIALAIANQPRLLIADEPTTALDVTIQAQVMEAMRAAQKVTGAAMILITHDLGLVAGSADRIHVMYGGRIFEKGYLEDIFYNSRNPYTRALLASIPSLGARSTHRLRPIPGNPPSLLRPPEGCPFRPRCSLALEHCREAVPDLVSVGDGHDSRCFRVDDLAGLPVEVAG
jgi:oligopeptide/dipeptide ABC transporter ATP-binding protein